MTTPMKRGQLRSIGLAAGAGSEKDICLAAALDVSEARGRTLAIWFPVNRSYARLPVKSAKACGPPTAASSSLHSSVVEESCQMGHISIENAIGESCSFNDFSESKDASDC